MDTLATIVRLSPLLFVTLVPFSEHIPYSVDYQARLAKEAEAERLAKEAMKPVITEQERYQMGQIRWYDYKTDLIQLQQRIDYTSQQSNDPRSSRARCFGCWIERTKARLKLSACSNAKSILAYFAQRMSFMFVINVIAKVSLVAFFLYTTGHWLMEWPPAAYLVDKVSALIYPAASQTESPVIRRHVHVGVHSAQPEYDAAVDDAVAGGPTAGDATAAAAAAPVPAFVSAPIPAPAPAPAPALATASMGPPIGPIRSSIPDGAAVMTPIVGATGGGSDGLLNATPRRQQHGQLGRDHVSVSDRDESVDRRQHAASPGLLSNRRGHNMQHHVESDVEDDRASRDGSPRGVADMSDVYGPGGDIDLPPADGNAPRDHSASSAVGGRVKKRVAFKDDDRGATGGQNAANLQLTALPVSYGPSIGSRRSATTTGLAQLNQHVPPIPGHGSPNRRVAPVNGIRSRQTASVGKLHTAL